MEKNVRCILTEKTSKSGNNYQCLVINLTPTYEKVVFLDKAELELLKATDKPTSTENITSVLNKI